MSFFENMFHMNDFELGNLKWVLSCGHFEAVYTNDSALITEFVNSKNMGIYNYYDPNKEKSKHADYDVFP